MNKRTISGIEFEAVKDVGRFGATVWRPKCIATGYVFEAGVFHGHTRPQMWEDMEHVAKIRGDLWQTDTLNAS